MLAQKSSTQFGDGEGALAFWKNSCADYHDEKKVLKCPLKFQVNLSCIFFSPNTGFWPTEKLQHVLGVLAPRCRQTCCTIVSLMIKV